MLMFILLLLAAGHLLAGQDTFTGVDRVVAVGDVHGDYKAFTEVLRSAKVIDNRGKWTGGKTHLVQTGDLVDRGPESRKAMDLLMDLEKQAEKAGGRVHVLLGNHEAMNMYGDLRYVSKGEFDAFRTGDSGQIREGLWEQQSQQAGGKLDRGKWEQEHPLGWVEQRIAFGAAGKYGKWLRGRNAVVKINDTLYVHGGISPRFVLRSLQEINQQVSTELGDLSKLDDKSAILAADGPLWYRGLANDSEALLTDHVYKVLKTYDVNRIVIAHTPTPGAVLPRFHGKVLMLDVGLSEYFGAHRACLVIESGKLYAYQRGEKVDMPEDAAVDLVRYLRQVIALEPMPSGLNSYLRQVRGASDDD